MTNYIHATAKAHKAIKDGTLEESIPISDEYIVQVRAEMDLTHEEMSDEAIVKAAQSASADSIRGLAAIDEVVELQGYNGICALAAVIRKHCVDHGYEDRIPRVMELTLTLISGLVPLAERQAVVEMLPLSNGYEPIERGSLAFNKVHASTNKDLKKTMAILGGAYASQVQEDIKAEMAHLVVEIHDMVKP